MRGEGTNRHDVYDDVGLREDLLRMDVIAGKAGTDSESGEA